jgi:hypothetical protein
MEPTQQSLVFNHSAASIAVSVAFIVAVVILAFVAARRAAFRPAICALETLRVLIAAAIAITLNQPEWLEQFMPDARPAILVLRDVSGSMTTADVPNPNGGTEGLTRTAAAEALANPEKWEPLKKDFDVHSTTFSSTLANPAEGTDINEALSKALDDHPQLKGVVLLSDGDWNTGNAPSQEAVRYRMRSIPVFAVPVGSASKLPDIILSGFDVPAFAIAGKPLRIPFSIESTLPRDEDLVLEMKTDAGEVLTQPVRLPAMGRIQDALTWKPMKEGAFKLTLTVPPGNGERILNNNAAEAPIAVRKEQLRVLVIETLPRWEFRYLRNALERDPGVQVDCLLLHPDLGKPGTGRGYLASFPKTDELAKYDVVFLGDVGAAAGQLTTEQCSALRKVVRDQATGLVFLPGMLGNQLSLDGSDLEDLVPVVWDTANRRGHGSPTPGRITLTENGNRSLLTKLEDTEEANLKVWQSLPGFHWHGPAYRAKSGTDVLAIHDSAGNQFGRTPLLVTKTFGAGKLLYMGTDAAWRWRKGVEDRYHYRFWGQVVRWMAYQRNMSSGDRMRLFYSPDRPRTDASITLNANVSSTTGEPLREGQVIATVTAPSGKTSTLRLRSAGDDAWGLFSAAFSPVETGEHQVLLACAEADTSLTTTISVQGQSRERIGQPVRKDVLAEIASITRGQLLETADASPIIQAVSKLPVRELQERRVPVWAHPYWAVSIVLLLGVFWGARKAVGSF